MRRYRLLPISNLQVSGFSTKMMVFRTKVYSTLWTVLGDEKNARVFLNPNQLSSDGTVALKGIYFSHNGKYATYSISRSGSDWQEFYVMDVKTGKLLDDHINWAKFSGASWQGDGFYYSAYDAPQKGHEFSNVNSVQKIWPN